MNNLNELVKEYKINKDSKKLDEIFIRLAPVIKNKAKHIFYQRKYKILGKIINLKKTGLVDFEDIIQELNILLLKTIQFYNIDKPFDVYFYSSLWFWRPTSIITRYFLNRYNTLLESDLMTEENSNPFENIKIEPTQRLEYIYEGLTDEENQIVVILFENPGITQAKIAEKLNIQQQRVSEIFVKIKRKIFSVE